jgi:hypothetical protein
VLHVLFRGHSTFTDLPDDTPPGSQAPLFTGFSGNAPAPTGDQGAAAPTLISASSSAAPTFTLQDTTPVMASGSSPQLVSVPSVVTGGPGLAVERGGDIAHTSGGDGGGAGEVGRDGDQFASLSIDSAAYADHGWFVVPSAGNEYGDVAYTAGDGFSFDVAAGEFTGDWVFIA